MSSSAIHIRRFASRSPHEPTGLKWHAAELPASITVVEGKATVPHDLFSRRGLGFDGQFRNAALSDRDPSCRTGGKGVYSANRSAPFVKDDRKPFGRFARITGLGAATDNTMLHASVHEPCGRSIGTFDLAARTQKRARTGWAFSRVTTTF